MSQDTEWVKRFRAARAYGGLNQVEMAHLLGTSESTLKRVEAGAREVSETERRGWSSIAAEACGLPLAFFFERLDTLGAGGGGVQRLERQLAEATESAHRDSERGLGELARTTEVTAGLRALLAALDDAAGQQRAVS